jgi:predicted RND superfamily exporter protein
MNTTLRIDTASGAEAANQAPTITSAIIKAEQSTKEAITEDALMKLFFTCEAALLKALEYARQNELFALLVSTFCIIASVAAGSGAAGLLFQQQDLLKVLLLFLVILLGLASSLFFLFRLLRQISSNPKPSNIWNLP